MFAHDGTSSHGWHYYGPAGQQQKDTEKQMKWLEDEFARGDTTDKIIIGMHIPPGIDGYANTHFWDSTLIYKNMPIQNAFLQLMAKHNNRIVGIVSSHTHMDGLRKMMHKDSTNGELVYTDLIVSIPGITPGHGNNPGVKLFSYDAATFEWNNFTTFYYPFWPTHQMSGAWKDDYFSYNEVFKGDTTKTLSDRVSRLDEDILFEKVMKIYKAKGQDADSMEVRLTLEVRPLE